VSKTISLQSVDSDAPVSYSGEVHASGTGGSTRRCTKCEEEKPLEDFSFRSKKANRRHAWCKPCLYARQKAGYEANPQVQIDRIKRHRHRNRDWMHEVKDCPCMDCGVKYHPAVMEFDHRLGTKKLFNVSVGVLSRSRRVVLEEMSKCDIVCANCHRMRTWNRSVRDATPPQRKRGG